MKFGSRINILLMPTDMCNMRCVYCYNKNHGGSKSHIMSFDMLKKIYDITFDSYSEVSFIWHGGEPLCTGLPYMQRAIALQKRYKEVKIRNSIQTNLTLMTEEYACFLKDNNISIGSSFDGLQNDRLRGNTKLFLKNRDMLLGKDIKIGVISVVSGANVNSLIENYKWFCSMGMNYTLNLYINTSASAENPLKLNPDIAAEKIIELYKYWLHDSDCRIRINFFERIARFSLLGAKTVCSFTSCLGKWLGIRWDGQIFPCNRYFPVRYSFGNANDYSRIDQAFESEGFSVLLTEAIERRENCKKCAAFSFCEGGCNNVAYHEGGVSQNGGETCLIIQKVFQYIHDSLKNIKLDGSTKYNPHITKYRNILESKISQPIKQNPVK